MNQGGLNLGSINLADPISLAFGIDQLMNSFCLGGIVDLNTLLALGVQNQQQMFLELAQLAQLQQLGVLNVFGAQNLIQSNLLFGGAFNILNAGKCPPPPRTACVGGLAHMVLTCWDRHHQACARGEAAHPPGAPGRYDQEAMQCGAGGQHPEPASLPG